MWITSDPSRADKLSETAKEEFENNSDDVISTAKWLHVLLMNPKGRVSKYNPYVHWLISNKNTKEEKWFSLRDNLMAMEVLGIFADASNSVVPQFDIQNSNGNWINLIPIHYGQVSPIGSNLESKFKVDFQGRLSGTGAGWLQVTSTYEVYEVATEGLRNERSLQGHPTPACPYQLSVVTQLSHFQQSLGRFVRTHKVEITPSAVSINPDEITDDTLYVIDYGLTPAHRVIEETLETMSNEVEHLIEYYRITPRNLLIYIRGLKTIGFTISFDSSHEISSDVPVHFYSIKSPGMRCSVVNGPVGNKNRDIVSECDSEDEVCLCGARKSCPRLMDSATTRKTKLKARFGKHCDSTTNFAYKISPSRKKSVRKWTIIEAEIISTFKLKENHVTENVNPSETHEFWYRRDCRDFTLDTDKNYLVIGASAITGGNGKVVKHLMDSVTWLEWWPEIHGSSCKLYYEGKKKTAKARRLYKHCELLEKYKAHTRDNECH